MDFNKMPAKDAALYYHNIGLMPIPVKEKKSAISWGDYVDRVAPSSRVDEWFKETNAGYGVALITGPVSQTIVLDLDGKEALQHIKNNYFIPKTWMAKTRKGRHVYFKWSNDINVSTTIVELAGIKGVDVRGRGGYVVAPPSYGIYQWFNGYAPWEVELAPVPDWLKSLINKNREVPQPSSNRELKSEQNSWVTDLLDGVESGGRHAAFIKLAGYFLSKHPEDIAEKFLMDWNDKNSPPMPVSEFRTQFADIAKRYRDGKYKAKVSLPNEHHSPNVKPLQPIKLNQFLDSDVPNIRWLVDRIIPEGTSTIFGGWQGLGKSWVSLDLAVEMAKGGGKWMDVYPVSGGTVLYIDEESTESLLKYRLKKLIKGKCLEGVPLDLHLAIGKRFKFTHEESLEQLKIMLSKLRPKLVIVDALIRVHSLEENSSKDMAYFFDSIIKPLSQDYGCSFLFIDHERKSFSAPGIPVQAGGQRLRGSSAKGDAIDTMVSLKVENNRLQFEHSKARFHKPVDTIAISIDDIGHNATKVLALGEVK